MGVSWSIDVEEKVISTQDLVKGMARLGEPEGKVLQAFEQERGKGRHGRVWVSEPGNLYISFILRPDSGLSDIPQLAMVTSLAAAKTIQSYMKEPELLSLKWPNDVLIEKEKCGGILLETELQENGGVQWVVVGVGMNVASAPPGLGVAIQDYADRIIDIIEFRNVFLREMSEAYKDWQICHFSEIKERWLEKSHAKDTKVEVKIGVQIETGFFHDIDDAGNMILRDHDFRMKKISAGEVHFLDLGVQSNVTGD